MKEAILFMILAIGLGCAEDSLIVTSGRETKSGSVVLCRLKLFRLPTIESYGSMKTSSALTSGLKLF